jgi:hypothetical protein
LFKGNTAIGFVLNGVGKSRQEGGNNGIASISRCVVEVDDFKVLEGLVKNALDALGEEAIVIVVGDNDADFGHWFKTYLVQLLALCRGDLAGNAQFTDSILPNYRAFSRSGVVMCFLSPQRGRSKRLSVDVQNQASVWV